MADLVVDTNILVDVGRDKPPGLSFLLARPNLHLAVSAMTQFELLVGCRNKQELRKLDQVLKRYEILKLTEPISDVVGRLLARYALSHGLKVADACIASTAIVHRIPLATGNTSDFQFIRGLPLIPYI